MLSTMTDFNFTTPTVTRWQHSSSYLCESLDSMVPRMSLPFDDDIIDRTVTPTISKEASKPLVLGTTTETFPYSVNDYFGRQTARLPTPPHVYSSNSGLVADFGSSGTSSPRDENCDLADTCLKPPPYLEHHHLFSQSFWGNDKHEELSGHFSGMDEDLSNIRHKVILGLLSLTNTAIYGMTTDSLQRYLSSAVNTMRELMDCLRESQYEINKKSQQVLSLQSLVANKDKELQLAKQQLAMMTLAYDAQITAKPAPGDQIRPRNTGPIKKTGVGKDSEQYQNLMDRKDRDGKCSRKRAVGEKYSAAAGQTLDDGHRHFSEKSTATDWQALVNKIVERGDQQASIFMQQKLKNAAAEQKRDIFKAITQEAYALMTSRFGNFLVQRFLEVADEHHLQILVSSILGRVTILTCHPFGSHVLQKVFDFIDEDTKSAIVQELCQSIPETIMHKHACHIWQKVFEMQWKAQPLPSVMEHVNAALQGKWASVALDETGSLVIQHIFENLTLQEKRPVLDEVLQNIIQISKGQWGNWVIQHVLEHAESSEDREKAFQVVLENAAQLSTDQFSSKVVEKALRIGGPLFVCRFLEKIMTLPQHTATSHRAREDLIDMASDQYGNYVVQWLINHVSADDQVKMCRLIKRHMVSLRGSKYGQRVAQLVEKALRHQDISTYPTGQLFPGRAREQ